MYILVASDGELSLQDSDNMRAFSIVEEQPGKARDSLAAIGEATEDDHYWLDANAVLELSERKNDAEWVDRFWNMLAQVEVYGYSDMTAIRVKAHLEQS